MEQIFFDLNPSLRQLSDNTQKMSDQMQRLQHKEMKKVKARPATEIDHADISTETELMGEDLMGSMDPDQFRGGGRRKSFLDFRKNMGEEEEQSQSGEKAGEAPAGQDEEPGPLQRILAKTGSDRIEYRQERPLIEAEKAPGRQNEAVHEDAEDGKKKSPIIKGNEKIEISALPPKGARKPGDQKEAKCDEPPEKKEAAPEKKSSHISLLAWDDDFIIAEPKKSQLVEEEAEPIALDYEPVNILLDDDSEDEDSDQIIDEMMVNGIDEPLKSKIRELINPFGNRVLRVCRDFGSRIALLLKQDDIRSLLTPEICRDSYRGVRSAYVPELKLCVFGEEHLHENNEPFSIPRFYFAHCFDNALGKDDFASLKSAAVISNYKACQEREPGHQFRDSFSALSPAQYFAQSVELFLSEEREMKDCLCGREALYDFDRSMYLYVDYLFRVINGTPSKRFEQ